MKQLIRIAALSVLLALFSPGLPAQAADCTNPTRAEGTIIYNVDDHVMQYCDGTAWIPMGPVPGAGGSGCANPTRDEGMTIYNIDYRLMQYCDGANWMEMGPIPGAPGQDGITAGLVAHWKLDETGSDQIADSAGTNTGTWTDGDNDDVTEEAAVGRIGGALDFNSAGHYVEAADSASLDVTGDLTVSAWIYPSDVDTREIIGKGYFTNATDNGGYWLSLDSGSGLAFFIANDDQDRVDGSTVLTPNAWYHIALTWDGTTMRAYLNGVEDGSNTSSIASIKNVPDVLRIGDMVGGGYGVPFDGLIDDVRVYNRALSPGEIMAVYNGVSQCPDWANADETKTTPIVPTAGARFGAAVAIDGTTAVIGAHFAKRAYIFDATDGSELHLLTGSGGSSNFGNATGISGDLALVGDQIRDEAHVFDTATGNLLSILQPADMTGVDTFGNAVAIEGNIVVVGGSATDTANGADAGAAWIFDVSDPGNPVEKFTLEASDASADDLFGHEVAISGTTVLVSALDGPDNKGRVYVFDATTGTELRKITAPAEVQGFDNFGGALEMAGYIAVIGTPRFNVGPDGSVGVTYLFDTSTGAQLARIDNPAPIAGDRFGESVAISADTVTISAPNDDTAGTDAGTVYMYDISDPANPFLTATLTASDVGAGDTAFQNVALDGDILVVGASTYDEPVGADAGSAYFYSTCMCDSPGRPAGTMLYNIDNNLMQYCNGEDWIGIGK